MNTENIKEQNKAYWNQRAVTYSDVNKEELEGTQHNKWSALLDKEIRNVYSGVKKKEEIKILDVGAGPGFISIVLSELGYPVTAADLSEDMLAEAKKNAGAQAGKIHFKKEDAMNLSFADESFDVVFSRNLTWNLPDPQKSYSEWLRVLKKGGCLLVFDANWYAYLRDEKKKKEYENDRQNVAEQGFGDYNVGENFDVMEKIAENLPLTGVERPAWDKVILERLGASNVNMTEDIGSAVYSEKEKINYASTPLFMIKAVK